MITDTLFTAQVVHFAPKSVYGYHRNRHGTLSPEEVVHFSPKSSPIALYAEIGDTRTLIHPVFFLYSCL